tara:strand:- start:12516 stop:12803 length:288 start_codon:yes stop_codon:yes gene_type:complete
MAEERRYTESELQELPLEDIISLVNESSFDVVPATEGQPGITESGSVAEASAEMVPEAEDPVVASNIDLAAQRRQATQNRLKNLRMAQDFQTESV